MSKYRVTYSVHAGAWSSRIKLSEIIEAEDLEAALYHARDWAGRQSWIPISVEELAERVGGHEA